jgi:hypothetical protein
LIPKNLCVLCGDKEMEVDFDKEIDTLLRKAQRDGPVLVGDFATQHLDADEISAFAENAMPETSRPLYLAHLAGCDRCRKILSNLLVMNSEVVPASVAAPGTITIAERSTPWYRKLFLFPNLAYVMGSLVLVFAGFLGFTIVRNAGKADLVSQVAESEPARGGPNFQNESADDGAASNSAMTAANSSANTATSGSAMANANVPRDAIALSDERGPAANRGDNNFGLDGASTDSVMVAPPPPPAAAGQAAPKDLAAGESVAKAKPESKAVAENAPVQEAAKTDSTLKQQYPGAMNQSQTQSGPMNRNERQYQRQLEDAENRRARTLAKKTEKRDEDDSSGRKVVGGRTFERKDRVWYDTSFQGRPTINVRRGTPEFNKLDGGLRSIANSLQGTIVVVWGAKAYRIQ